MRKSKSNRQTNIRNQMELECITKLNGSIYSALCTSTASVSPSASISVYRLACVSIGTKSIDLRFRFPQPLLARVFALLCNFFYHSFFFSRFSSQFCLLVGAATVAAAVGCCCRVLLAGVVVSAAASASVTVAVVVWCCCCCCLCQMHLRFNSLSSKPTW